MIARSRAHLAQAGEEYLIHMRFAATVGLLMIGAGLACLLHAIVPALCQSTCSRTVDQLQALFADRRRLDDTLAATEPVLVFTSLLLLCSAIVAPLLLITAASPLALVLAALCFAMPVTFLATNPQLSAA